MQRHLQPREVDYLKYDKRNIPSNRADEYGACVRNRLGSGTQRNLWDDGHYCSAGLWLGFEQLNKAIWKNAGYVAAAEQDYLVQSS